MCDLQDALDSLLDAGDQMRPASGGFKSALAQDLVSEVKNENSAQLKRLDMTPSAGHIDGDMPVVTNYNGIGACDTRHMFSGMLPENGQSMYYTAYEFPQPSAFCSQPQGPYISNLGSNTTGYCGPQYAHYYQQISPITMQYYPTEQEVNKAGTKKPNVKDAVEGSNGKPIMASKLSQNVSKTSVPDLVSNWGFQQAFAAYYGSALGYDCYLPQQWHSSTRGFQPIPPLQNLGAPGSNSAPLPGAGALHFQSTSRTHSNFPGKTIKGNSVKAGSAAGNWRAKESSKVTNKGDITVGNALLESCFQAVQKFPMTNQKVPQTQFGEFAAHTPIVHDLNCTSVNRSEYNQDNFQVSYEAAKFFIIKSYSEDDVHKSIKYSVWSSTPNGNKRLDEAYRKAQEKKLETTSSMCPVFFFFSVNCSGQFCGVAEMVGPVDFGKNMDFWLQGKWNGCLPVKWHIIKDVPNGHFRHIILSNNDNKPVTHSRDTQEVHFHQGLEMLKIFKFFPMRTSLLDDFAFYDSRQRVLQERKSRQQLRQQVVKQPKERSSERATIAADVPTDLGEEHDKLAKSGERLSNEDNPLPSPTNESEGLSRTDSAKIRAESINYKLAEMKVDRHTASEVPENIVKKDMIDSHHHCTVYSEKSNAVPESSCPVSPANPANPDKSSKLPNAAERTSTGKDSGNTNKGVQISLKVDESKPTLRNCEAAATSVGKKDTPRMIVNYKKALLEGIQGKPIVTDQPIGA
ncbi:hypothetical protein KP509_02G070900 [Ceratopteris richardii]|uniref:YTH domain-containing protein n=1 Tax=Ceratopteris richardii TaxID=49495 RepID=A0A8T2VIE8_CERRI|nr:hypothetical protein KP509_02G070900 [Ceratopteris richardii]